MVPLERCHCTFKRAADRNFPPLTNFFNKCVITESALLQHTVIEEYIVLKVNITRVYTLELSPGLFSFSKLERSRAVDGLQRRQ
jgi:hypothetical protein